MAKYLTYSGLVTSLKSVKNYVDNNLNSTVTSAVQYIDKTSKDTAESVSEYYSLVYNGTFHIMLNCLAYQNTLGYVVTYIGNGTINSYLIDDTDILYSIETNNIEADLDHYIYANDFLENQYMLPLSAQYLSLNDMIYSYSIFQNARLYIIYDINTDDTDYSYGIYYLKGHFINSYIQILFNYPIMIFDFFIKYNNISLIAELKYSIKQNFKKAIKTVELINASYFFQNMARISSITDEEIDNLL